MLPLDPEGFRGEEPKRPERAKKPAQPVKRQRRSYAADHAGLTARVGMAVRMLSRALGSLPEVDRGMVEIAKDILEDKL